MYCIKIMPAARIIIIPSRRKQCLEGEGPSADLIGLPSFGRERSTKVCPRLLLAGKPEPSTVRTGRVCALSGILLLFFATEIVVFCVVMCCR